MGTIKSVHCGRLRLLDVSPEFLFRRTEKRNYFIIIIFIISIIIIIIII